MKLDLKELLRKVGNEAHIQREEKMNFAEDHLILTKPVKINLHLTNTGTSVMAEGTFETEVEQECSRCLKIFKMPLTAQIEEEYSKSLPTFYPNLKEVELKENDFVYPIDEDDTLDLDEIVRQNLILALPIKPLCPQDSNVKE